MALALGRYSVHVMSRRLPTSSSSPPSPVYYKFQSNEAQLRHPAPEETTIHDDHILESRANACAVDFIQRVSSDVNQDLHSIASASSSSNDCAVDDDMEPTLFECKRWLHRSSSPSSSSSISCEGCLHVTSAASECSIPDETDGCRDYITSALPTHGIHEWCADERKVEAEFLAPTQKTFGRRRKRKEECMEIDNKLQAVNAEAGYIPAGGRCDSRTCGCDGKQNEESMLKDEDDMPTHSSRFVHEAIARLQDTLCKSSNKAPQKDPTDTVQHRLENLLLAVQTSACEHKRPPNAPSDLELRELLDRWSREGAAKDSISKDGRQKNECSLVETAGLQKRMELSFELAETKAALTCRKKEYRGRRCRLGVARYVRQSLGEEMYCKEAIRKIVAQVQAETEQWSEIEKILEKLREEIDGLNKSQKIWEDRALTAESQVVVLQEEVHDWRCRAQSAEEEMALLRSERQILKNKIVLMEDVQRNLLGAVPAAEEVPRPANVGTCHEDFAPGESFVHSRNESGRSSVDLGATSQRSFRKSIKKAFDFANNSGADGNTAKFWLRNPAPVIHTQMPKEDPASVIFSSSKKADLSAIARHKNHKARNQAFFNSSKPISGHEGKERKKARHFTFKENLLAMGVSMNNAHVAPLSPSQHDGLVGLMVSAGQGHTDQPWSKSKSSLPSAPASTPSRLPLGDILNLSRNAFH